MSSAEQGDKVDLIGMAYQNARTEGVQLRAGGLGYLKVVAPAKVNLYLAVGEKRADGYHPVENVMHTLLLHDVLYMRCMSAEAYAYENGTIYTGGLENRTPGLEIHLTCTGVGAIEAPDIPPEKNIVYKALVAFASAVGRAEDEVMDVHLEKHVPHQAGWGGGSADAAAALVGAAKLWGIAPDDPRVEQVAQKLGADVAFFLRGGCALYDGVGEHYVRALTPRKESVVLIKPAGGLSTPAVYKQFDAEPVFVSAGQKQAMENAQTASEVPLFNGLEAVAGTLDAELARVSTWALEQPGVVQAMLTGSGSCTFAICEDAASALRVTSAAQAQGWWAAATYFANIRAAIGR